MKKLWNVLHTESNKKNPPYMQFLTLNTLLFCSIALAISAVCSMLIGVSTHKLLATLLIPTGYAGLFGFFGGLLFLLRL